MAEQEPIDTSEWKFTKVCKDCGAGATSYIKENGFTSFRCEEHRTILCEDLERKVDPQAAKITTALGKAYAAGALSVVKMLSDLVMEHLDPEELVAIAASIGIEISED